MKAECAMAGRAAGRIAVDMGRIGRALVNAGTALLSIDGIEDRALSVAVPGVILTAYVVSFAIVVSS